MKKMKPCDGCLARTTHHAIAAEQCWHTVNKDKLLQAASQLTLRTVFCFGDSYAECSIAAINRLEDLIGANGAQIHPEFIPGLPSVFYVGDFLSKEKDYWVSRFSGRTAAHKELCGRVALWFEANGTEWGSGVPITNYQGGMCDVAAKDGSLYVECGYTKASKIYDSLLRRQRVMVVPYTDTELPLEIGFRFEPMRKDVLDRFKAEDQEVLRAAVRVLGIPR